MSLFTLRSSAFESQQVIPRKYTGDGADVSPPLAWSSPPADTREFALIVDDPDAPTATPWVHWVIYRIPRTATGLPEHVPPELRVAKPLGAAQGANSWPEGIGYRGPAPPQGHGVHHYHFRLYALDTALKCEPGLTKDELLVAIDGHVLAQATLVGAYQR